MDGTMREIGGYLELERFYGAEYYEGLIALDCARNALAYVIEARGIHELWIPDYLCTSVFQVAEQHGTTVHVYPVRADFTPDYCQINLDSDSYLYLVDYYGQLSDTQLSYAVSFADGRIVVDEVMCFFRRPRTGIDTLYCCRKFFGVADGAYLATNVRLDTDLPVDESHARMGFVLGRFERPAGEFYAEASANNSRFAGEPIRSMSKVTQNLLRAIDYERVQRVREENYAYLMERLTAYNELVLASPPGPYMYPLLVNDGQRVRKALQRQHIFVPTLWPNVTDVPGVAGRFARDILPLPVDQRYSIDDMAYMCQLIAELL